MNIIFIVKFKEMAITTPVSSVFLKVESANNNTTERSEIQKSGDNYDDVEN